MGPILTAPSCFIFVPGHDGYALGASAVFYLPGYKHFMRWIGVAEASRANFVSLLQRGSVAVMVGGIAEMCAALLSTVVSGAAAATTADRMLTHWHSQGKICRGPHAPTTDDRKHLLCCRFMLSDDHEAIMLKSRRGFAKVSIESGCPIVPVYHLGNSRLLHFGPAWLRGVSRTLRMSVGLVFGQWWLPLPVQHPLHLLSGKAIRPGLQLRLAHNSPYVFCLHQHCSEFVVMHVHVSAHACRDFEASTRAGRL
jgi:diacylglycerol O-acyltransferase 2, plant